MATSHGKDGVVRLGAVAVAEITGFTFESSVDIADDSVMGDAFKTHLTGLKEWSGSIDCFWDEADTTGQVTLDEGVSVTLNLYPSGVTTGKKYYSGTATVSRVTASAKLDGINTRSLIFVGNGTYSILTAP